MKTQFGKQLLRAIAAERRVRMPWLLREARAAGQDLTINGLALGAGLATGGLAELYLAGPGLALARTLGPAAKFVPPAVEGLVSGATQQVGTAYTGGERDPQVLAREAGKGAGIGMLAGFLGGLLPAKSLTPLQRAVAQANLEVETAKLHQALQRVGGLSRKGQEATRRLAQVHAKLAELEELGAGSISQRPASERRIESPSKKPPVLVNSPTETLKVSDLHFGPKRVLGPNEPSVKLHRSQYDLTRPSAAGATKNAGTQEVPTKSTNTPGLQFMATRRRYAVTSSPTARELRNAWDRILEVETSGGNVHVLDFHQRLTLEDYEFLRTDPFLGKYVQTLHDWHELVKRTVLTPEERNRIQKIGLGFWDESDTVTEGIA